MNRNDTMQDLMQNAYVRVALGVTLALPVLGWTRTVQAQELAPAATDSAGEGAEERQGRRFPLRIALGGRLGYGLGMFDLVEGSPLAEGVAGIVPVVFDATARFANGTEAGLYTQLALGIAGDALNGCDSCSIFGARLGVQLNHHFASGRTVDPWIGFGVGFDWLTISTGSTVPGVTTSGAVRDVRISTSTTYRALPEGMLQAGIDFGGEELAIGPFVSFSIASYATAEREVECSDFGCPRGTLASSTTDIADEQRSAHAWLLFGIHGNYLL